MGKKRTTPLPQPEQVFDRLTVKEEVPVPERWQGTYRAHYHFYRCVCVCGTEKIVDDLRLNTRNTKSCGCLQREAASRMAHTNITHGEGTHKSKEYRAWRHMKSRCLNPNVERFPNYGGRGIEICPQWLNSFETFLADVGRAPSPKHSLGRRENDGPYVPSNVRWETAQEQGLNSRHNRSITFQDETLTIGEWAKRTGINRRTIQARLDNLHYTVAEALTLPPGEGRRR